MSQEIPEAQLNTPKNSVANIIHYTFPKSSVKDLVSMLSGHKVAVSNGSACAANHAHKSHVLLAMCFSEDEMNRSLRFSLGKGNNEKEIEYVIEILKNMLYK